MKNGDNYLEEMVVKRKAMGSTVTFMVTNDDQRVLETIRFLREDEKGKARGIFGDEDIIILDGWTGLKKVGKVSQEGKITFTDVSTKKESSDNPFEAMAQAQQNPLKIVDERIKNERTVLILTNVRLEKPHQPNDLDMALESWCGDGQVFRKNSTVLVFTHSTELYSATTVDKCNVISIMPSTSEERREIILKIQKEYVETCKALADVDDKLVDVIVQTTGGLNKTQTESALLESIYRHRTFDLSTIAKIKAELLSKKQTLTVEMRQKFGFEGIGGYPHLKEYFTKRIVNVVKNRKGAEALGLKHPRGLILFGMAGTGKTAISKALAKEVDMPFVNLNLNNILRGIVGESEQRLKEALATIDAMSPCIVFIDEIDRFGSRGRGSGELDGGTRRELFSELLSWLGKEERECIVIATTNRPQDLDEAMRRVGRFDGLVPQLLPDREARVGILQVHTNVKNKVPLGSDVDFDEIAELSENFNGAEVTDIVQRACFEAFNEGCEKVTQRHFKMAVSSFTINIEERKKELETFIAMAQRFTNDKNFIRRAEEIGEQEMTGERKLEM